MVVTARVKPQQRAELQAAQHAFEASLREVGASFPETPAGLGVTVAWGLPYLRRLGPLCQEHSGDLLGLCTTPLS